MMIHEEGVAAEVVASYNEENMQTQMAAVVSSNHCRGHFGSTHHLGIIHANSHTLDDATKTSDKFPSSDQCCSVARRSDCTVNSEYQLFFTFFYY